MSENNELSSKEAQKQKLLDALKELHRDGVRILDDSSGRPRVVPKDEVARIREQRLSPFLDEAENMFDLEEPHGTDPYNKRR